MSQAQVKSARVVRTWRAARPRSLPDRMHALGCSILVGLIAASAISAAASGHSDEQKSGTHWLRKCTSPEANGQIECAIYVRAVVEYDELRGTLLKEARFICPAKGLTIGQSREIVLQYLRAHPQDLNLPFVLLAHQGLAAAFPCAPEPGAAASPPAAPAK
jgi:hypothetical protein